MFHCRGPNFRLLQLPLFPLPSTLHMALNLRLPLLFRFHFFLFHFRHYVTLQLRCMGSFRLPHTRQYLHCHSNFARPTVETAPASLPHSITTIISGQRTLLPLYGQCYRSHLSDVPSQASTLLFPFETLGSVHPLYFTSWFRREL